MIIHTAQKAVQNPQLPTLYKEEAKLHMGKAFAEQEKWKNALECFEDILESPFSAFRQKAEAAVRKTLILCADPGTVDSELEQWVQEISFMRLSGKFQYEISKALCKRAAFQRQTEKELLYAQIQLKYAPAEQVGEIRNRIAFCYRSQGHMEKSVDWSRETVAFLRKQLAADRLDEALAVSLSEELLTALQMIPDAPEQEIIDTVKFALDHGACRSSVRERLMNQNLEKRIPL